MQAYIPYPKGIGVLRQIYKQHPWCKTCECVSCVFDNKGVCLISKTIIKKCPDDCGGKGLFKCKERREGTPYGNLLEQRDALLAACKEALPIIEAHYDWGQSQRELLAGFRKSEPVKRPIEITLKDAIANAEEATQCNNA